MSWQAHKLGKFISIKHGWAFKGEYFSDAGKYILLTPGNAHETGGLKLRPGKEKFYLGDFPPDYLMKTGDMLVVMTDLIQAAPILGGAIVVPEDDRFLHNQRLGLVEFLPDVAIDKGFLYYLLNSPNYRAQVRGSATGATVRHTAPTRICDCNILIPDTVAEQQQVAQVLSAYDDLIATNQRRIQLLEEAARLLYREWFVHLRFPGHESITLKDGVPGGWKVDRLDSAFTLQRGFDLPASERIEGDTPIIASTGICGTHNVSKVAGPGVVTGRSGTLGEVHFISGDFWPLNTTLWVKEFKQVTPVIAYFMLKNLNLASLNAGASVPSLDRKTVHPIQIVIPSAQVQKSFDEVIRPIFAQLDQLTELNNALRVARDTLLPKLMSGRLDVSNIALPDEVIA